MLDSTHKTDLSLPLRFAPALLLLVAAPLLAESGSADFRVEPGQPRLAAGGEITLPIRVEHPAGGIVKLRTMKDTVRGYHDDIGTDLHEGAPTWQRLGGIQVDPKGRFVELQITGRRSSAGGAAGEAAGEVHGVHAEGELTIDRASGRETAVAHDVVFEAGQGFEVGDIPVYVKLVREDPDPTFLIVHLHFTGVTVDYDPIIEIHFLKNGHRVDGAQIIAQQYLGSEYIVQVRLPAANSGLAVAVDHWLDFERVQVPFEVSARF